MQFSTLRERAAYWANQAGAVNWTPAPDWCFLVNEANQSFAWEAEYNTETIQILTVANQPEYPLASPMFKYVETALYDTNTMLRPVTETEIGRIDRLWLTAAAGYPIYFWLPNSDVLRLYPKPASGGVILTIRGTRGVSDLLLDSDTPNIPSEYHEGIAIDAALRYMQTYMGDTEVSQSKLGRLQQMRDKFLNNLKRWIGDNSGQMQRTVVPRLPERTGAYPLIRAR